MRILMVNKFLYPRGGAETYVMELGKELERQGHTVDYFGMYDQKNVVGNSCGLEVDAVDFHKMSIDVLSYPKRVIWSEDAYWKIIEVIHEFKPDVVHLNNFNYQLTPSVIDACQHEHVPVVFTAHDSQLLCPNHLLYDAKHNTICTKCVDTHDPIHCLKTGCIHGSYLKSYLGYVEGKRYKTFGTYKYINCIVCPSEFMKNIYDTDDRFKKKTVVLQNYVKPLEFETEEDKKKIQEKLTYPMISGKKDVTEEDYIFYFGRLSPEKGFFNILEAAEQLPTERFVLAGSIEHEYQKYLDRASINVTHVGFKKGVELKQLIANAKMVILPSTCYENCPLAVIEAQQLGVPVVVPGYGGAKELTDERYQIKDTSVDALVQAILKAENHLEEMKTDSSTRTKQYLSLEKYAEKMLEIYEKAISKRER